MAVINWYPQATMDGIRKFVEVAFRTEDSLFTPGRKIWKPENRAEIYERFVLNPDTSQHPFTEKFRGQIGEAGDESIQFAAELLYSQMLGTKSIKQAKKVQLVEQILGWMEEPVSIPEERRKSLKEGLVVAQSFAQWRFAHLRYLLNVLKAWDEVDSDQRQKLLSDPWAFKEWVSDVSAKEAYSMAEMLLFYVHPDTFESITSLSDKKKIVKAFEDRLAESSGDRDKDLFEIRRLLSNEYGEGFSFYEEHIRRQWDQKDQKPKPGRTPPSKEENGGNTTLPETFPLNVILYGPPGTGKTYQAVERAVEICDGTVDEDRHAIVDRYKKLAEDGRIDFVTFHQSYGYEEFVEGYRPVSNSQGEEDESGPGGMQYEVQDGAFKGIASSARVLGGRRSRTRAQFDPSSGKTVWKMSLGRANDEQDAYIFDTCMRDNMLLLGYGQGLDYAGCSTRDEVLAKLHEATPEAKRGDYEVKAVHSFKNEMDEGDFVVVTDGNRKFRAIGRVAGPYQFHRSAEYGQMRPVEWLLTPEESISHEKISRKNFSQRTLYPISQKQLKAEAFNELLARAATGEPSNHVLIIDEINRGNISKILGELITLLEPDKRLGRPNELKSKLPYSGDDFGVPPNLYVIGTMNTADRSIAFLDTALRRRFDFEEIMPDADVIRKTGDNGVIGSIDVAGLLDTINGRIERLFDRDHMIGHSYLLGCQSLRDLQTAFRRQVIPLLQEYFYGDWERVCLVLGCPWDSQRSKPACVNQHPLIVGKAMAVLPNGGSDADEFEDRLSYSVNPDFLKAEEQSLPPFFSGIQTAGMER